MEGETLQELQTDDQIRQRLVSLTRIINGHWSSHTWRTTRNSLLPSAYSNFSYRCLDVLFDQTVVDAFEQIIEILETNKKFLEDYPKLKEVLMQRLNHFYFDVGLLKSAEWYKRIFEKEIGEERTGIIYRGRMVCYRR